jgi:hypothetical protein
MDKLYKHSLFLRLLILGTLTLCLSLLSHKGSNIPLASTKKPPSLPIQTQPPTITVLTQNDAPLHISSPRILSWDGQRGEFAFEIVNVSGKPIRAYAIKQGVEAGTQLSNVLFSNLDLTNHPWLQPNQSLTIFDTCQAISEKAQRIILSVDYVEFSDGTNWGMDSAKSAERSAGQRAAAYLISKRLFKILSEGNSGDVMNAIEAGAANIEPPAGHSDEWKEGFRSGSNSIVARLKNAQKKGDLSQVEQKLRQLAERY